MKTYSLTYFTAISFLFISCNLFNPSGSGDLPDSASGLVSVGQSRLASKDWDGAVIAFKKAIGKDSSNSLAYYGYAKAVGFKYELKELTLLKELQSQEGSVPFSDIDTATATSYLQGTHRIKPVLATFIHRDSLAEQNPNGSVKMDRFIRRAGVIPDYGMISLIHTVMNFKDLNQDSVINSADNPELINDLVSLLEGNGSAIDSQSAANANQLLENLSNGVQDVADIVGTLGDLGGSGEELKEQLESGNAASNATFYKFGDGKDNDGDGCVDEEVQDGVDNDGDGLVDEDSRIAPWDNTYNHPTNGLATVGSFTDPSSTSGGGVTLSANGRLQFTAGSNFWPSARSDSSRKAIADSLSAQTPPYTLSSTLLQNAKNDVGGCWNLAPYN